MTLYVREGIVMAADSRLTLNATRTAGQGTALNLSVGQTDSTNKLFLLAGARVGISTVGAADVGGAPIGGYMQGFESSLGETQDLSVERVAARLLEYFHGLLGPPSVIFEVAGYLRSQEQLLQQVWQVDVASSSVKQINVPGQQGAVWSGEADVIARLLSPMWQQISDGQYTQLPAVEIPWGYFTLQDAVDFTIYAIRTTIDSMRFQVRPKTVGGPIDVLVIDPSKAYWVQHKALHV
jgi:hypothetical protein